MIHPLEFQWAARSLSLMYEWRGLLVLPLLDMRPSISSGLRLWRSCKKRLLSRFWAVELWTAGSITSSGLAIAVLLQVPAALVEKNKKQFTFKVQSLCTFSPLSTRNVHYSETETNLFKQSTAHWDFKVTNLKFTVFHRIKKQQTMKWLSFPVKAKVAYFAGGSITYNIVTPYIAH